MANDVSVLSSLLMVGWFSLVLLPSLQSHALLVLLVLVLVILIK